MQDDQLKVEALKFATAILCQGTTAGKGEDKPEPSEVLDAAKTFYEWFKS